MESKKAATILGICIALGLSSLGFLFKLSVIEFKQFDRTVVVKGLAEREVEATLVVYPLLFSHSSNSFNQLYKKIESDSKKILAFLAEQGIKKEEIIISPSSVVDKFADRYADTSKIKLRYTINKSITVRSNNVKNVIKAKKATSVLLKSKILLTSETYQNTTRFIYTELNKVKPEMIKEATQSAREAALQFAKDSKSQVGKIKSARQGLFSIDMLDKSTPHLKKIRVVTTVTYYLRD